LSQGTIVDGVVFEESKSRSGKHIVRKLGLILLHNNGLKNVMKLKDRIVKTIEIRPTYSKGWAKRLCIKTNQGDYVIQIAFVKNFLGKVKGYIEVYNYKGELVYRAVYKDGELRRSIGEPIYAWIIRLVSQELRIPVKKTRLGDEKRK